MAKSRQPSHDSPSVETAPEGAVGGGRRQTGRGNAYAMEQMQKRQDPSAQAKKALVDKLWAMHEKTERIRRQANSSAAYYGKVNHFDGEAQDRMVAAMERVSAGAGTLRTSIMTSLAGLYDDNQGIRAELSIQDVQEVYNTHLRTMMGLEHDLSGDNERHKPNTSLGGGLAYSGTAVAVQGSAAVNGALSQMPVIGETYDRLHGNKLKSDLLDTATHALDAETANNAVSVGDVAGRIAPMAYSLLNPTSGFVLADSIGHGTVEAVTGQDVRTGKDLTGAQRLLGGVTAGASGLGALSKVGSMAKMNNAVAAANGTKAAPTVMSQVASGANRAKDIAEFADTGVSAATGHSAINLEKVSPIQQAFNALTVASKVGSAAANNTQTGKFNTALNTKSTAQQVSSAAEGTLKAVDTANKIGTALTGTDVMALEEKSGASRLKAGMGAAKNTHKAADAAGDSFAKDIEIATQDLNLK